MPVVAPILPSSDFDLTGRFYARLGFVERARYPGEYLIIAHPVGIELHFFSQAGLDRATNHAGCYVRLGAAAEAAALHDDWAVLGLDGDCLRPLQDTDYGLAEFALLDPDRNLLRIGGPVGPMST